MDTLKIIIQIIIFVMGVKILDDIRKNKREILVNSKIDILIIITGTILCITLNVLINNFLPLFIVDFSTSEIIVKTKIIDMVLLVLTGLILAPVLEEVLFRYYLYERLRVKLNIIFSISLFVW